MRPLERPADVRGFEIEALDDLARADALVARHIDELDLPTCRSIRRVCTSQCTRTIKAPRVVFVMNPTPADLVVRASIAGVEALVDVATDARIARAEGAFELSVPARVVRILAV